MTRARDLADLGGSANAGTITGSNLIINGAMQIAQRNDSSAVTVVSGEYQTVDRIQLLVSSDGSYTNEQSTTAPEGFTTSLKFACTGADSSIGASQYAYFRQSIEGQNLQHLKYGTSAAEDITLSFWVRSNKTGTYCITVEKFDTTRYHFVKEYSINTADTWEYKTITIKPDSNIKASGGVIDNNTGQGIRVDFWLAGGSTFHATDNVWSSNTSHYITSNQENWLDSTSNDFYITGIKLEVGSTATPYPHETYAETLRKCQRYYHKATSIGASNQGAFGAGTAYQTTVLLGSYQAPVEMRTTPDAGYSGAVYVVSNGNVFSVSGLAVTGNGRDFRIDVDTTTSMTQGDGAYFQLNNNGVIDLDAEF